MREVLGSAARSQETLFRTWCEEYALGHYTEVVKSWQQARTRLAGPPFATNDSAVEAVGWSVALTKQWNAYATFRLDLDEHAARHATLFTTLESWRAIHEGRYDSCLHGARGAREAALAPGGGARLLAHALRVEGVALFRLGRYHEAESATRQALGLFELASDPIQISHCATNLGLILNARGDIRAARDQLNRSMAALREIGAADERLALVGVNLAVVELHLGHVAEARVLFESSLETFENLGLASERITSLNGLGHCARVLGRFDIAEKHYRDALTLAGQEHPRQTGLAHEFLGQIFFDQGNWEESEKSYSKALDLAAQITPDGDLMLEVSWRYAELLAVSGRPGPTQELVERAEALCAASQERRELGCVQRARARLLAAEANTGARAVFENAYETLSNAGRVFEAALTLVPHGHYEIQHGDRARGLELLEKAKHTIENLAPGSAWIDRIESEIDQQRTSADGSLRRPKVRYGFWTCDPDLSALLDSLPEIATTSYPVLLQGESGTGKELIARALHTAGSRSGQFVAVNCAAIPHDLFESELFGHVRGSFSGASNDKPGLLELAENGTLLLDEIGEIPLDLQAKLLRVLDDGLVRRVGDVREREVQVKIVAATNRPLQAELRSGIFREDLYHRLAVHPLQLKPLRDRPCDIELLARHFLQQEELDGRYELTADRLADLTTRPWPGNVRELRNHLLGVATQANGAEDSKTQDPSPTLRSSRSAYERRVIESALSAAAGSVPEASRALGLHVTTLRRKMRSLGIARPA